MGYLIGGVEKTIKVHEAALMNKVPHIFKMFYEEDILEEELLFEWAKKVSKKYVSKETAQKIHDKAAPFIKWLKEAEEESDSEDSDGVEVDFDGRAHISKIKETSAEPPEAPAPKADEKAEDDE